MLDTTPGETRRITRAAVLGYFNCVRKAYLHLFTQDRGEACEYSTILDRGREKVRLQHIDKWTRQGLRVEPFSPDSLRLGSELISDASLSTELFSTDCAILIKVAGKSRFGNYQYEPAIVAPAHEMRPEDKLDVLFAGHVLSQVQDALPLHGSVLLPGGNTTRVKLATGMKYLMPYIGSLKKWLRESPEPPAVLLNKHCSYCEYRGECRSIAEKEDSLSLLGGVTRKIVAKYEKKGIFTVKQLSYLYKPRKHPARRARRLSHQYELQALALRTGNIYLHEPRDIPEQNAVTLTSNRSRIGASTIYLACCYARRTAISISRCGPMRKKMRHRFGRTSLISWNVTPIFRCCIMALLRPRRLRSWGNDMARRSKPF